MTAIAFDTLKFAKRLKDAGFTEQQAETLAAAEAEFIDENLATKRDLKELEVALKRDIKELEVALKRDIKELEVALKRDMKELEYGMTIKLGAMMVVAVGAIAALAKLL
ncbi:MAG: hypothetical protein ACT4QB_00765 [Gammaproteobacteria bacterium]